MIYGHGSYCYAIGGIPVGTDATPLLPKDKTIIISSNSGTIGATAYLSGSAVTSWSATDGSASANIPVGSSENYDIVFEVERPEGYSSTISSTGLGGTTGIQSVSGSSITFSGNTISYSSDPYISVNGVYSTSESNRLVISGTTGIYQQGSANILDENWTYGADITFPNSYTADPMWNYLLMERPWGSTARPHYQTSNMILNMDRLTDIAVTASHSFSASYQFTAKLQSEGWISHQSAAMQAGISSITLTAKRLNMQTSTSVKYIDYLGICSHYGSALFFDPGTWTYSAVVR